MFLRLFFFFNGHFSFHVCAMITKKERNVRCGKTCFRQEKHSRGHHRPCEERVVVFHPRPKKR